MTTAYPAPPPSLPVRGQVQRTFVPARVLTGFMDEAHVQQVLGEFRDSLDEAGKADLATRIANSQTYARSLQPVQLDDAFIRPIVDPHIIAIQQDPVFQKAFAQHAVQFGMIKPEKLVALQVHVKPRADVLPTAQDDFLNFMFPQKWDIPAEISFIPPGGPIQILSSDPTLQGVQIELDTRAGKVMMSPHRHINLVQVVSLNGRYFLKNGYHRVFDCITAGRSEIPALIVTGIQPGDLQIGGNFFAPGYAMTLPRPPLVADFISDAAIDAKFRERRYGVSISLQMTPLNIGI